MKISNNEPLLSRQLTRHGSELSRQEPMHNPILGRQMGKYGPILSRQLKALGSKGGRARAIKLTPTERQEIASKAANARWHKGETENNGLRST